MKTCPNCGELVGNDVKSCFNCKYSFLFGRYIPEGEELTQHDMAHAIYETYCRGEKREYYEIAGCIIRYEDDEAVRLIQKYFHCDEMTAKETIDLDRKIYDEDVRARGGIPETKEQYMQRAALVNAEERLERLAEQNKPKCPTCGSTLVKRLSVVSRGASVAVWGATSNKFNKSFECKNCGYTW